MELLIAIKKITRIGSYWQQIDSIGYALSSHSAFLPVLSDYFNGAA